MASPEILDFEALLAPISDEAPAGVELKSDPANNSVYYDVKDARDAARSVERQAITSESEDTDPPDWTAVKSKSIDAISRYSKDLWFAAWLIEALCRLHGFAGLRDGFRLVRRLCEQYWDGIHPEPDDDGYATTTAQLRGLNGDEAEGALLRPIDAIPLTRSPNYGELGMADFQVAADLQQISDSERRQTRIEQGAVTLETFDKAVRETPADFYRTLYDDIQQAIEEFRLMTEFLDQHCGEDEYGEPAAPPSSNIRQALEACRDRVKAVARHILEAADVSADESSGEDGEMIASPDQQGGGSGGRLATRDDALNALLKVADYFRRTEPHSPVSYSLEQAVRWGRMSLPDLISELVTDENVRAQMFIRMGINDSNAADSAE